MATLVASRYRGNHGGVELVFSEGYPGGWRVNFFKGVVKPILNNTGSLYGYMGITTCIYDYRDDEFHA